MVRLMKIENNEQAVKINRMACRAPYELWLSCGREFLDARSMLGLFTLVGKEVYVVADDSVDARSFDTLVDRMAS